MSCLFPYGLTEIFAVCFDDFLIPVEAVFFHTLAASLSEVIKINIDVAVTFVHFCT